MLTHPLSSPPDTATQLPSETCSLTVISYISVMSTDLPYTADAQVSLSYDELEVRVLLIPFICSTQHSASTQVLQLQYKKELAQLHVTIQTKFNYAWGLVKSPVRKHQVEEIGQGRMAATRKGNTYASWQVEFQTCPAHVGTAASSRWFSSQTLLANSGAWFHSRSMSRT